MKAEMSWVEVNGAEWRLVHGLSIPNTKVDQLWPALFKIVCIMKYNVNHPLF